MALIWSDDIAASISSIFFRSSSGISSAAIFAAAPSGPAAEPWNVGPSPGICTDSAMAAIDEHRGERPRLQRPDGRIQRRPVHLFRCDRRPARRDTSPTRRHCRSSRTSVRCGALRRGSRRYRSRGRRIGNLPSAAAIDRVNQEPAGGRRHRQHGHEQRPSGEPGRDCEQDRDAGRGRHQACQCLRHLARAALAIGTRNGVAHAGVRRLKCAHRSDLVCLNDIRCPCQSRPARDDPRDERAGHHHADF